MQASESTHFSQKLYAAYASQIDAPSEAQWKAVLGRPADQPLVLINCFRFRKQAEYSAPDEAPASGHEAFARYAAVSSRVAASLGVDFIHMGPVVGSLFGGEEAWDLVVVGRYPHLQSFIDLYLHPEYLAAVHHRTAACAAQRVLVSG